MSKLLIIEDDRLIARIYEHRLLVEGFEVLTVADGQAGLEALALFRPDAVLLDLMLPKLSGVEFIKRLRGNPEFSRLPIIVFSNASGTDLVREAMSAGANKFLTKYNCPPEQVIAVLRSVLSDSSQGSRVVFPSVSAHTLPEQQPSTPPSGRTQMWVLSVPSILLLEDNCNVAELLTIFLEAQSFQVTHVTNGADGVRQVMANDFDAIVCDMVMPNLPGDMFYKAVERTKPHLCRRFVFMTGYQADPRWAEFIRKVNGIMLWKPFPLSDLLTSIRTVMRRSPADGVKSA
jgi:DNA-binding response OmpR family regulator